jgi:hypothetical protein
MTVLSHRPHRRYSHGNFRTNRADPEPRLEELLDDSVLHAVMASDGVDRARLEALIAQTRLRLGLAEHQTHAALEFKLLLECS